MVNSVIQPSFSAGEVSPTYYGRVDLAKYHVGLALMRNFFVDVRGGASTRPGTIFVGRAKDSGHAVRLIPFRFSTIQTYALEFGEMYMRVIKDGAYVLETAKNITGATNANPAVITSAAHGLSNGDEVYISGVGGMTQLNGKNFLVAGVAANTFQLHDLDGNNINSTSYGVYTSGGTVARVYTLTTPYAAADLELLKYTQNADVLTLTHLDYAPRDLTRTGHTAWTLSSIVFAPAISPPTISSVTPSAAGLTWYTYTVTAIDSATGEESVGAVPVNTQLSATMSTTAGAYVTIAWSAVSGAQQYNIYRQREVPGSNDSAGGFYGFVGSSLTASFKDINILPDFTRTPPYEANPFTGGNNPGCSCYFQQRKVFAGSTDNPETLWMTQTGAYKNMDVSLPTRDTDAITATLASQEVNAIQFLVSSRLLIALTTSAAWQITGGTPESAITPTTIKATSQVSNGCNSTVPPLIVNNDIIYVQFLGATIRDLSYDIIQGSYQGDDISVLSNHLFTGYQVKEWSWSEVPFKIIWAVRNDGKLLSLSYMKDQQVYGWARHDTNGRFQSVCSIPEGEENATYVVVERKIQGQYVKYIERFASRIIINDVSRAWCVDSGLSLPWTYPANTCTIASALSPSDVNYLENGDIITVTTGSAFWTVDYIGWAIRINGGKALITAYTSTTVVTAQIIVDMDSDYPAASGEWSISEPVDTISGLDHLEGQEVVGLADGGVFEATVQDGAITLDYEATDIIVGLAYTCQMQTLPLDVGDPTIQGKRKLISAITVRVNESRGLKCGADFEHLKEIKERGSQPYGQAIPLISMDERIGISPLWQVAGQVCIEQSYPLPATVLAVIPEITVGDNG